MLRRNRRLFGDQFPYLITIASSYRHHHFIAQGLLGFMRAGSINNGCSGVARSPPDRITLPEKTNRYGSEAMAKLGATAVRRSRTSALTGRAVTSTKSCCPACCTPATCCRRTHAKIKKIDVSKAKAARVDAGD